MPLIQYKKRLHFRSAESLELLDAAIRVLDEYADQGLTMTLRQLYYQLVAADIIPNEQKEYDRLGDIINRGRLMGRVDWDHIQDRTRFLRTQSSWATPEDIIKTAAASFKLDLWEGQKFRPEVWIEKDALIGVIEETCERLRIPYFSCRGYSSQSESWRAGMRFVKHYQDGHIPIVLHMGDHDPSGVHMTEDIQERMTMYLNGHLETEAGTPVIARVKRLALNMDQVKHYGPPPNPAKMTDSRAPAYIKKYSTRSSWELDALRPDVLVKLIDDAWKEMVDEKLWKKQQRREAAHKKELTGVVRNWDKVVALGKKKKK